MVGTEQEALAYAVAECAINGREWFIARSDMTVVWHVERDIKVEDDAPTWPVIVHLRRRPFNDDEVAILTEVAAMQEP